MCESWMWTQLWSAASLGEDKASERKDCWQSWRPLEEKTVLSANVAPLLLAAVSVVTHQKHTNMRAHSRTRIHTQPRSQTQSNWQTYGPRTKHWQNTLRYSHTQTDWYLIWPNTIIQVIRSGRQMWKICPRRFYVFIWCLHSILPVP